MRILVDELPKHPDDCHFVKQGIVYRNEFGMTIDVAIDSGSYYCKISNERCDLASHFGHECSGLAEI